MSSRRVRKLLSLNPRTRKFQRVYISYVFRLYYFVYLRPENKNYPFFRSKVLTPFLNPLPIKRDFRNMYSRIGGTLLLTVWARAGAGRTQDMDKKSFASSPASPRAVCAERPDFAEMVRSDKNNALFTLSSWSHRALYIVTAVVLCISRQCTNLNRPSSQYLAVVVFTMPSDGIFRAGGGYSPSSLVSREENRGPQFRIVVRNPKQW